MCALPPVQERTLASYNKDVLGVLEAVTLRLSRVENSVDGCVVDITPCGLCSGADSARAASAGRCGR